MNTKLILKQLLKISFLLLIVQTCVYSSQKDIQLLSIKNKIINSLDSDDENQVKKSIQIMKKLIDKKSTPQRESYLGALRAKMATFSFFPWSKISYANKGSKLLDKAVKKDPNDIDIRLMRIFTYVNFPSILKKDIILQNDIRWLLKTLKRNKVPKSAKDSTYKALAMFFARQKDNVRYKKYFMKIKNKKNIQDVIKYKNK